MLLLTLGQLLENATMTDIQIAHGCTFTDAADGIILLTIPNSAFPETEPWQICATLSFTLYPACHGGQHPTYIRTTDDGHQLYLDSVSKLAEFMELLSTYLADCKSTSATPA
jgi:hypothetical protein